MRKVSLLLLAGGILTVASCKEEGMTSGGMTQTQVDSAIQSKVNMALDSMAMATDARINELAMYMADSMMKAKQGITVTTQRPAPITRNPSTGTTPPPAPAPTPTNPKEGKLDRIRGTESNTTPSADQIQKKEDKLNRMRGNQGQ